MCNQRMTPVLYLPCFIVFDAMAVKYKKKHKKPISKQ